MSDFKTIGPASILVCISSPVLSKKPVFIKIILSLAIRMHSFRFTVVLLSSSMIPIFTLKGLIPNSFSTAANRSQANLTSLGPCILGLTIYTLPFLEFTKLPVLSKSCLAIHMVNMASSMPSGISLPCLSKTAGFVMRCPTFRTSIKLLPGKLRVLLSFAV